MYIVCEKYPGTQHSFSAIVLWIVTSVRKIYGVVVTIIILFSIIFVCSPSAVATFGAQHRLYGGGQLRPLHGLQEPDVVGREARGCGDNSGVRNLHEFQPAVTT